MKSKETSFVEVTEEDVRHWEDMSRGRVGYTGEWCEICDKRMINTWDLKLQKALMYRSNICEHCIAKEYGMTVDALRSRMEETFGLKPCRGI